MFGELEHGTFAAVPHEILTYINAQQRYQQNATNTHSMRQPCTMGSMRMGTSGVALGGLALDSAPIDVLAVDGA